MNPRFLEFTTALTQRDGALLSLAGICLAGLVSWWGVRAVFSRQAQDRVLTFAAIAFYGTLVLIIFYGGST